MSLLDRLLDLEKNPTAKAYSEKAYSLDHFRIFVDSLGAPDRQLSFIHVAGTKGKGSVVALCEALLLGQSLHTAAFTSPHLEHFGERFREDGIAWTPQQFEERLEEFYELLGPEQRLGFDGPKRWRTVFETLTALALARFEKRQRQLNRYTPQIVCWETGLGGRLDCTNIVSPLVTVITTMALDHQAVLGDTIEAISREKAGIVKSGRPVIIARQAPEFEERVLPVLLAKAADVGAPVIRAWEHNPIRLLATTESGQRIELTRPDGAIEEGILPLLGNFQRTNLEAAVAAVWYTLKELNRPPSEVAFLRGLESARWPGRLEIHRRDTRLLVLDGAHCPYSAATLADSLKELLPQSDLITLLFSMQRDKAIVGFLKAFSNRLGRHRIKEVVVYPLGSPRAATTEALEQACSAAALPCRKATCAAEALDLASTSASILVSAGTLYSIHAIRSRWKENNHASL